MAAINQGDDASAARLSELISQVAEMVAHGDFVSYQRAQQDVIVLSAHLRGQLSAEDLAHARFVAVPRGGHVVLGLLALALDLRPEQLAHDHGAPLTVLVDDAALTGYQLQRAVAACGSPRIVVALLHAPAALRETVEQTESRVEACLSARTVPDIGDELLGSDYPAWRQRWREETGDDRYWIGRLAPLVFAWKEPDRSFLNSASGRREAAWRLFPPSLVFGAPLDPPSPSLRLVLQPPAHGPLQPHPEVFTAPDGEGTLVADPRSGEVVRLDRVASATWDAIVTSGSLDGAVAHIVEKFDADVTRVREDVVTFVRNGINEGLLTDAHG